MSRREPLRDIAVIGGGQVALLAACAMARTLPGARVRVVQRPLREDGLADRAHTTLPTLARLHDRIGVDDAGLIARAGASHRLATRVAGLGTGDASWLAHGSADGPAAALAQTGRYAPASDDPASPLSDVDHALRWSPTGHAARLASLAQHLRVTIEATHGPVDADLVIDTVGPADRADDWIDWSAALPVDRVALRMEPPALSVTDRIDRTGDAIMLTSPGRDATRVTTLSRGGDGVAIRNGRRGAAWDGRVVAIGDAAAMLPPIGWANLHLAVLAIELLVELLPGRDIDPLERAEWNRRFGLAADATHDFVAAHLAGLPAGHPLAPVPSPTLDLRLREYARRGRIPYVEEDAVPRDLWTQLLRGIGIVPGASARVAAADPVAHAAIRATRDRCVAQVVAAAAPYPAWLARTLGASA